MTGVSEPATPQAPLEREAEGGPEDVTATLQGQKAYRDVIVVGASAGGVEALGKLAQGLPPELPASVFVVLHMLASGTSVLPAILERRGNLPASSAVDGPFERGRIYVAPPDQHLLLWGGDVRLSRGPRENGHRPAIDPLFRSAARSFGPRVIAVVLSGSLDDGAAGMRFVKERGGAGVVQDPDDALYPDMPTAAASFSDVDRVVPVGSMPKVICGMLEEPIEGRDIDAARRAGRDYPEIEERAEGDPSGLTCPECGGALWQRQQGSLVRFACRTGHAFSPDSLVREQGKALEAALWSALRGLEERADLFRRMARRAAEGGGTTRRFEARVRSAERDAQAVRQAVDELGPLESPPEAEPPT